MLCSVSRRIVLRSVISGTLVATAGCLSANRFESVPVTETISTAITTDLTTTESTSTSGTAPYWRRCDGRRKPSPPTSTGNFDPKLYPTVPEELTGRTIIEFAKETERAYVWNRILERERNLAYVDIMSVSVTGSKHTGDGFVVEFGYGKGGDEDSEASVHADGAVKTRYFVNDRFVGRVDSED